MSCFLEAFLSSSSGEFIVYRDKFIDGLVEAESSAVISGLFILGIDSAW